MNDQELRGQMHAIIAKVIEVDEFRDDEDFVRELGVDSMMGLEIVARVEKAFKVRIPEEKLREIRSLNDVVRIVQLVMQPVNG